MNVYRIFPVLWNDGIEKNALTVYGIDRVSPVLKTTCSKRVKEDPAYYWDDSTFQRIFPTASDKNYVTWATLPSWLSYARSVGYMLEGDLSRLKPYSDIYITGP